MHRTLALFRWKLVVVCVYVCSYTCVCVRVCARVRVCLSERIPPAPVVENNTYIHGLLILKLRNRHSREEYTVSLSLFKASLSAHELDFSLQGSRCQYLRKCLFTSVKSLVLCTYN